MEIHEYTNIKNVEDTHWWYISTHRAVLRELTLLGTQSKVLDAGCGSGGLLSRLQEQFKVTGFDASVEAVRAASERKYLSQRIAQGVIEAIPLRNGQFDAVTCIDVIYHQNVISEQVALSEMRHSLRPGGYLILQVPAFECLRGGHDQVVHTRKRYTLSEVKVLLQKTGFRVVKIRYRYPWLFIPALVIRRYSRNSKRSDLQSEPAPINALFSFLSSLTDAPCFSILPFGTSIFAVAQKI